MTNVIRLFEEADRRIKADDNAEAGRRSGILASMDRRAERKGRKFRGEDDTESFGVLAWCVVLVVAEILLFSAWQAKSKAAADLRMYETLRAIE